MSRYKKAADTIKLMRKPVPWTATAAIAIGTALNASTRCELIAAEIKLAAIGAE